MPKITVHRYLFWDHQNGRSVISPWKVTVDVIERLGGKICPGTAEDVDCSALDEKGRLWLEPHAAEI